MFAAAPDASKVAFVVLVEQLGRWGFPIVDCQVHTDHLARFGAANVDREWYLEQLAELVYAPPRRHPWTLDAPRAQK